MSVTTKSIYGDKEGLFLQIGDRIFRPRFPKPYLDAGYVNGSDFASGSQVEYNISKDSPLLSITGVVDHDQINQEIWCSTTVYDFLL